MAAKRTEWIRKREAEHTAANKRAAEKRELTVRQGRSMFIGASLSLKSLCCLRATGSALAHPPWTHRQVSPCWRKRENLREEHRLRRGRTNSARRGAVEGARKERRSPERPGRDISSQGELRSRNRLKRVGQTDDRRRASTALRTQEP